MPTSSGLEDPGTPLVCAAKRMKIDLTVARKSLLLRSKDCLKRLDIVLRGPKASRNAARRGTHMANKTLFLIPRLCLAIVISCTSYARQTQESLYPGGDLLNAAVYDGTPKPLAAHLISNDLRVPTGISFERSEDDLSRPLGEQETDRTSGGAVQASGGEVTAPRSLASIAGIIRDAHGAVVTGIPVTLLGRNNAVDRVAVADRKGAFTFAGLRPGVYRVKIDATGLEPSVSAPVMLGAGERRELPIVAIRIPTQTTTVHVVATLNEVAQAQVQEEEKQRVLGFLPNYYSSYIWTAAPMTPKLKVRLGLRSTIDPFTFLVAAAVAGAEQKHNTFPGYGQGAEGYAKRFGAAYADTVVSRMVSRAILPAVLHQDPRYFYRGSGGIRSRLFYAMASTFVCRGDNGRLEPNYSQLLGNFAAAGISNVYRAPGDQSVGLTFRNGLIMTGSGMAENILREFFSRKLTPNVPTFANGKP